MKKRGASSEGGEFTRRAGIPITRGMTLTEWVILLLIFASVGMGALAFGAVRMWSFGTLSAIVAVAGALFFARPLMFRADVSWSLPPGILGFTVFLLYAAVLVPRAEVPYEAWRNLLLIASAPLAYLAYTNLAGRNRRWKILFGAMLLLIIAVGSYAIWQEMHDSQTVLTAPALYGKRRSGTFICPNHFASLMAAGATLAFALIWTPEIGMALRLIAAYAIGIAAYGIHLSQSRAGMIGLAVGLVSVAILTAWNRGRKMLAVILFVLGPCAAVASGWALYTHSPIWKDRISAAIQGRECRPMLWKDALQMAKESPIIGRGGGSYRWIEFKYHKTLSPTDWSMYAHNEYVHTVVEYGGMGLLLAASPLVVAAAAFLRRVGGARRKRDGMLAAAAVSVGAAVSAHAFFDFNFHIYSVAHFAIAVMGLCAAALHADGEFPNRMPGRRVSMAGSAAGVFLCLGLAYFLTRATGASVILQRAEAVSAAHQYDQADRLYESARQWDPLHWEPLVGLARTAKNRAAFSDIPTAQRDDLRKKAEKLYLSADQRNQWCAAIPHGLGEIYNETGRPEQAVECLKRLTVLEPRNGFFYTRLGAQLREMGRLDEAESALKIALKLDGGDRTAKINLRAIEMQRKQDAAPVISSPGAPESAAPGP